MMMKKLLLAIVILASVGIWQTADASIKKSSETITIGIVTPLDTTKGVPQTPDSIHVVARPDNATAASYTTSITAVDGDQFDCDTVGGQKNYFFKDVIGDLDGAGGNFELCVMITAYCVGIPTQSPPYYVQVLSDSLENFLDAPMDSANVIIANLAKGIDSINAILDTLQLYDGRYALASELTKAIDSINAILDTVQLYDGRTIASVDSVRHVTEVDTLLTTVAATATVDYKAFWDIPFDTSFTAGSMGDSMNNIITVGQLSSDIMDSAEAHGFAKEATVAAIDPPTVSEISTQMLGVGMVTYSQPDSIINVRGIHVRGTTAGDTAIIADANNGNTDRGFFIRGGNAALQCKATGTVLGVGILAQGGDDSVGVGMQLEAGGSLGDGLLANGYGATHAGIRCATDPLSGAVSFMADDGLWVPEITGHIFGGIDTIPLDTSKFTKIIDSLQAILDSIQNHSNWNIKRADSVGAGAVTAIAAGVGSSTLDSATVEGAAKAALQAGIDASFGKIHATNLIIEDVADDDTGGIYVHSPLDDAIDLFSDSMRAIRADAYGSRPTVGLYAHNNGDVIRGEIVTGATGSGSVLFLKNSAAQTTTGRALRIESSAGYNTVEIGNTSNALLGRAWYWYVTGDSASTVVASNGSDDTTIHTHTFDIEGPFSIYSRYDRDEPAFLIHKYNHGNYPAVYIYSDSTPAVRLSTSTPEYYDTAVLIGGNVSLGGNKFVGEIVGDIHGKLDTVLQANHLDTADYTKDGAITATLNGTGGHSYMLLCLDTTAAPDAPVNHVQVDIWNLAQTVHTGVNWSNINGYAGFNLDTGMYVLVSQRPGYYFPTPDTVHVTGAMYDTTKAYQSNVGLVSVGGYIYGLNHQPLKEATLVFSLPKQRIWLDADSTIVWAKDVTCYTDSLGYYSTSLIASSRMFITSPTADTLKYNLSITYGYGKKYEYSGITIPDSISVTFSPSLR